MKKINHIVCLVVISTLSIFGLAGCDLDNDQKTALLAASIQITAMTGTKIAVSELPDSVASLILVADGIEVAIDDGDVNDLKNSISALISDKVPSQYAGLIQVAIAESLTLYDVFARQNLASEFDQNKQKIALALATGIRSGLSSKSAAEDLSDFVPDSQLFQLD